MKHIHSHAWCMEQGEVVSLSCHWSCEGCTYTCKGPHFAIAVDEDYYVNDDGVPKKIKKFS